MQSCVRASNVCAYPVSVSVYHPVEGGRRVLILYVTGVRKWNFISVEKTEF